jgi:hypothetical protein
MEFWDKCNAFYELFLLEAAVSVGIYETVPECKQRTQKAALCFNIPTHFGHSVWCLWTFLIIQNYFYTEDIFQDYYSYEVAYFRDSRVPLC